MLAAGTVVGFAESLLPNAPLKKTYTAASFVHLLYFDRAAVMAEAERRPQLLRSLWWFIAAQAGFAVCPVVGATGSVVGERTRDHSHTNTNST